MAHDPMFALGPDPGRAGRFMAVHYGEHPVTRGFRGGEVSSLSTYWWDAVPVLPAEATERPAGARVVALVSTSEAGWGETDPLAPGPAEYRRGLDLGPGTSVAVAALLESGGRLVVLGSRRFAANEPVPSYLDEQHLGRERNLAFLRNAVWWLLGEERVAPGISGRQARMRMLWDARREAHMFAIAFLYIPLAIILLGSTVWAYRYRHRLLGGGLVVADLIFLLYLVLRVLQPLRLS
jgi:hypothetical protein